MTGDLNLGGFRIFCRDVVERDGTGVYDVRVMCERHGKWDLVGVLNLSADEWLRLRAVFQAHEAQYGLPVNTTAIQS